MAAGGLGRWRAGAAVLTALVALTALPAIGSAQDGPEAACSPGTPHAPLTDRDTIPDAHRDNVDCAYDAGITQGYPDGTYRPTQAVRRDHMASFIARTLDAAGVPLDPGEERFTDLTGSPHADAIHRLAAAEIVLGTTPTTYSPEALVRRDQIASFVLRAVAYARGDALAELQVDDDRFTDVPAGNVHRLNINGAADVGLAKGRSTTGYDPGGQARRDQMGTFLVRALAFLTADDPAPSPSPSASPSPGPGAFTLELLGHHDLAAPGHDGEVRPRGNNGDVAVIGATAFVAAGAATDDTRSGPGRICTDHGGVKVVDLSDPSEPALLGVIDVEDTEGVLAGPETNPRYGLPLENVAVSVRAVDAFRHPQTGRHVLALATQRCEPPLDTGARVELWDVSDPAAPTRVGVHDAGSGAVTDVRLFGREEGHGSGVYALVTVPGSAESGGAGDVRLLDISDIAAPDPATAFPSTPPGAGAELGCRPAHAARSAAPTPDLQDTIVSWYDGVATAGASAAVLRIPLDDPPVPTGDPGQPFSPMPRTWGYTAGSEGNAAHVETFTGSDNHVYALVSEDDLDPATTVLSVEGGSEYPACALPFAPRVHDEPDSTLPGEAAHVGRGCPASPLVGSDRAEPDPYLTDPDGRVAFVAAGGDPHDGCSAAAKVQRAVAAGATAVVLDTGGGLGTPALGPDGGIPGVPVVTVATPAFSAVTDGAAVSLRETAGATGAQRLVDFSQDPPEVVATYRSPGAQAWPPPGDEEPRGVFAPHGSRVVDDLAFTTWHSDGLRVLDLADPAAVEEVGSFVPPDAADPSPQAGAGPTDREGGGDLLRGGGWPDRALVTGVAVEPGDDNRGLVVVSDVHGGLYVLRYEDTRP